METIAGMFQSYEDADRAVAALEAAGFDRTQISVLTRSSIVKEKVERGAHGVAGTAATGAATGGLVGGLVGVLMTVGAIAVPGLGPVMAAGALAATLGGSTVVGAAVGGILGAMTGLAIPEEQAHLYAEGVKRGGILITVRGEGEMVDTARRAMRENNAVDIEKLQEEYRAGGWERFEETVDPEPGVVPNYPKADETQDLT